MIDRSHHAHLVIGPAERVVPELEKIWNDAEIIYEAVPQWGIEHSRSLRERQARQVGEAERRCFILAFSSITIEAEQALLKTLEEPAARTFICLVAPSRQLFLPTVLSRLRVTVWPPEERVSESAAGWAAEFLAKTPEARIAMIGSLLAESEEPAAARTRAIGVVEALLVRLHAPFKEKADNQLEVGLMELERARDYLHDRAAAPRLILEHLALVI